MVVYPTVEVKRLYAQGGVVLSSPHHIDPSTPRRLIDRNLCRLCSLHFLTRADEQASDAAFEASLGGRVLPMHHIRRQNFSQFYNVRRAWDMMAAHERAARFTYDTVIRVRPDLLFLNAWNAAPPSAAPPSGLHIGGGPKFVTDQIFYGDRASMAQLVERLPTELFAHYRDDDQPDHVPFRNSPEHQIGVIIEKFGIPTTFEPLDVFFGCDRPDTLHHPEYARLLGRLDVMVPPGSGLKPTDLLVICGRVGAGAAAPDPPGTDIGSCFCFQRRPS
jgi:hypothetical protein